MGQWGCKSADGLVGYDTALTRQGSRVQFPVCVLFLFPPSTPAPAPPSHHLFARIWLGLGDVLQLVATQGTEIGALSWQSFLLWRSAWWVDGCFTDIHMYARSILVNFQTKEQCPPHAVKVDSLSWVDSGSSPADLSATLPHGDATRPASID